MSSWSSVPKLHEGYAASRSLIASGGQKYLWYSQPLSMARTKVSSAWESIRGMEISFTTPRTWSLRFSYSLQVQPQRVGVENPLRQVDSIMTRISIDGRAFRESSAASWTLTKTSAGAALSGELVLKLPAGRHVARVEWKKVGGNVATWWCHPGFLDGFVSGRSFIVTGEHYPFVASQEVEDAQITRDTSRPVNSSLSSTWRDIGAKSSAVAFTLPSPGSVTLHYDVAISQGTFGNFGKGPNFDSWLWQRWSSVATRLVIDGRPMIARAAGAGTDVAVQGNIGLTGTVVASLPAGPHTAHLQWRTFGSAVKEWRTLQNILDGYASSRTLLVMTRVAGEAPWITAPSKFVNTSEDVPITIAGFEVSDRDVSAMPGGQVDVSVQAEHGTVSLELDNGTSLFGGLSYVSGDGKKDAQVSFSATIEDANRALNHITYTPFPNWHGVENITLKVTDQGHTGTRSEPRSATASREIRVSAVNDRPLFSVPAEQSVDEDSQLLINGIGIYDIDVMAHKGTTFFVSMSVIHGTLSLNQRSSASSSGVGGDNMKLSGPKISISGDLSQLEHLVEIHRTAMACAGTQKKAAT